MKLIIAGSRTIRKYKVVELAMALSGFKPTEIFSGKAEGVDSLGEFWAREHKIPVRWFIAWWELRGPAAGPMRNEEMAREADALLAVWDGKSRGTKDMINRARTHKLQVKIFKTTAGEIK